MQGRATKQGDAGHRSQTLTPLLWKPGGWLSDAGEMEPPTEICALQRSPNGGKLETVSGPSVTTKTECSENTHWPWWGSSGTTSEIKHRWRRRAGGRGGNRTETLAPRFRGACFRAFVDYSCPMSRCYFSI